MPFSNRPFQSHSKLNQIHLRKVRWRPSKHNPAFPIQTRKVIIDPHILPTTRICPPDFVVAYPQIVMRNPNHRSPCPQCFMLERTLYKGVSLGGSEVLDRIYELAEEGIADITIAGMEQRVHNRRLPCGFGV